MRILQLKPTCVELLGLITSSNDGRRESSSVYQLLNRLHDLLADFNLGSRYSAPLSPSLINYVFFPLAQLLRGNTTGSTRLPDRILQRLFDILALLTKDWWRIWSDEIATSQGKDPTNRREQWKVWEQLLILGAATLTDNTKVEGGLRKSLSDETQHSITAFLYELLLPRVATRSNVERKAEWEWDGEEKLPSLDDYDRITPCAQEVRSPSSRQIYPSSSHLRHIYDEKASKGAIAHAVSSTLSLAADEQLFATARVTAIKVSRILIDVWLGGNALDDIEKEGALVAFVQDDHLNAYTQQDSVTFGPKARADRVATFLPGYVSSMVRILTSSGSKTNSAIVAQALQGLSSILTVCLSDAANEDILAQNGIVEATADTAAPASIATLVQRAQTLDLQQQSAQLSSQSNDTVVDVRASSKAKSTGRNLQWLENSVSHIVIALHSIKGLTFQDSSEVQLAMLGLAFRLLSECNSVIEMQRAALNSAKGSLDQQLDASSILLNCILNIAGSSSVMDIVSSRALEVLKVLFSTASHCRKALEELLVQGMQSTLISLPDLLDAQKEEGITRAATRLAFACRLATLGHDNLIPFNERVIDMFHANDKSDQWIVRLLWSLRINDAVSSEGGIEVIMLKDLSVSASRAVMALFTEIGRSCARLARYQCEIGQDSSNKAFELIFTNMNYASSHRVSQMTDITSRAHYSRLFSLNALLVTAQMMRGVAQVLDDTLLAPQTSKAVKRLRRVAHRLAKGIVTAVCTMWEEDEEELLQPDLVQRQGATTTEIKTIMKAEEDNGGLIEHSRGLQEETSRNGDVKNGLSVGPAIRLDFVGPAMLNKDRMIQFKTKTSLQLQREAHTQLNLSDSLLLSILASAAKIMGPSIQPLLLQLLYPVICGVASSSIEMQSAAAQAMDELSRSAGFASVQACISSHADYVLGTASHRLISSLSAELQAISNSHAEGSDVLRMPLVCAQSAPLVLIEVIRMLGGEALTLVQDAIDEVLDAIDRHHQQPKLCDDLLSVLDRLVEVMHNDERIKGGQNESKVPASLSVATKMIAYKPDIEKDLADFEKWWRNRSKTSHETDAETPAMDDGAGEMGDEDEESQKATSSQIVLISTLQKAIPFLSHSSAIIRIRSVRLLNRGIELLCLQGRTVEPLQVISTAWPMIMSRLGFSLSTSLRRYEKVDVPSYEDLSERDFMVCIEACKLVDTLSKYLIDYLGSEKMIRQAIPRLLLLLKIVERAEGRGKETTTKQGPQTTILIKDADTSASLVASGKSKSTFRPIPKYTPLYTMAQVVLTCLDTIVNAMGVQITEADLFAFATHPTLFSCLDHRQDEALQRLAHRFYFTTLTKRNENLVWLIINGAKDTEGNFPLFLHKTDS